MAAAAVEPDGAVIVLCCLDAAPGPCAGVTLASCREPDAMPTVPSNVWRGNIRTFEI